MSETTTATDVLSGLDLNGRTIAITGATAGMGRVCARAFAAAGARVAVLARNPEAVSELVAQLQSQGGDAFGVTLDLARLESVREGAAQLLDQAPSLDVLMNNAGVMFTPFGRTADGFETQIGVCHLGHFALTEALVPALAAGAAAHGSARVVVLASAGHKMADLDLTDLNWETRPYDKFAAYGAAKTANVLHAREFARRHPDSGITALAVHPGTVATDLARHMTRDDFSTMFNYGPPLDPDAPRQRARIATPEQGASTQVWAAVAPELSARPGAYLADRAVSDDVAPYARDSARAAALWDLSLALTS